MAFNSWSVGLSSTSATEGSSTSTLIHRKCSGGKPSNLGARDNRVDDLFGPPYSSMMPNSLKGNESGMFLQNWDQKKYLTSHAKIIMCAEKKATYLDIQMNSATNFHTLKVKFFVSCACPVIYVLWYTIKNLYINRKSEGSKVFWEGSLIINGNKKCKMAH